MRIGATQHRGLLRQGKAESVWNWVGKDMVAEPVSHAPSLAGKPDGGLLGSVLTQQVQGRLI